MPPSPPDCGADRLDQPRGAGVDARLGGRRRAAPRPAAPAQAPRPAAHRAPQKAGKAGFAQCCRAACGLIDRPLATHCLSLSSDRAGRAACRVGRLAHPRDAASAALCADALPVRRSRLHFQAACSLLRRISRSQRHSVLRLRTGPRRSDMNGTWMNALGSSGSAGSDSRRRRCSAAPRVRADRDQILARLQVRRPGGAVRGRDRQGLLQGRRASTSPSTRRRGSLEPINRVASGTYDMGFGDINSLIKFRDANPGTPIKAVFMVYNKPPFSIVGRKSRGVDDAEGPRRQEARRAGRRTAPTRNGRSSCRRTASTPPR